MRIKQNNILVAIIATILLSGCTSLKVPTKLETYPQLYTERPLSVLLLPPINRSTKVEAKELFYSSLTVPLTQKGYYVMPPLLTMEILREESAYDSEMYLNESMKRAGQLFGADAVLFTIIHSWNKTTIASQINVEIEYILKSTKSDEILFNRIGNITLSISMDSGNTVINILGSMLATALTKEIGVGRTCNIYTLSDIPAGIYNPLHGSDSFNEAMPRKFRKVIEKSY